MIVIMLASLALASREGSELSRRQARILFGAVLIPILGNIVYLVDDKDVTG